MGAVEQRLAPHDELAHRGDATESLVRVDGLLQRPEPEQDRGQRLARLAERETVTVYVTPGKHIVGARFASGPGPSMEREFVAETQKPVRIRVSTEPYSGKL